MKSKYSFILIIFLLSPFAFVFGNSENITEIQSPEPESEIQSPKPDMEISNVSTSTTIYFFHSITCPHCRKEVAFLDKMGKKYPEITINRYEVSNKDNVELMKKMAKDHDAERVLGSIPLTFIGERYFVGYDKDSTSGKEIENEIQKALGIKNDEKNEQVNEKKTFNVPFFGTLSEDDYSLPVLAVLLGILDGFNVCSLGALVLIIGLALKLQNRRAIIALGGTFILTTAIIYGALIVAWYHVFELFSAYLDYVKALVALISLGGGIYFLKEYIRMQKEGAVCEMQESKIVNSLMSKTTSAFENKTKILAVLGSVFVFAAVLAIVEFPCSAAVPVVFAGVLSDAGLKTLGYLSYISLFVLFYMLDEIIIFGIAAYKLKLWMTNGKFTKYAVLAEALILIGIGVFYVGIVLGLF